MAKKKHSQQYLDAQAAQIERSAAAGAAMMKGIDRPSLAPAAPQGSSSLSGALVSQSAAGRAAPQRLPEGIAKSELWDNYGLRDFAKDTIGSESLLYGFMVMAREQGYQPDLGWSLPNEDSDEWKSLTEGLDPEHWDVFGRAVSAEHARHLRDKTMEEISTQRRMMEYGGVAGVLAANVLNPENLLLGVATGGIGWVQKGNRLRRALKNAGVVGAENVAIEAALGAMHETRDEWDVLTGAVAGIALGGAFGAAGRGSPTAGARARADLDKLAEHEAIARGLMDEVDARLGDLKKTEDEIRSAAAARRAELTEKAAGAVKRSELGALGREVGSLRKSLRRDADLLPQVEARMLAEDIQSMGEALARSKHHTKMRRDAAKLEVETRTAPTRERLARAEALHKEKLEAEDSLRELRRVERREKKGLKDAREFLDLLGGDRKVELDARLTKQRDAVAKALKLSRRAERGGDIQASRAAPATGGFGPDTASAARVSADLDYSVRDISPGSAELDPVVEFPQTAERSREFKPWLLPRFSIKIPRFDFASILRGNESEVVRGTAGLYTGDGVGSGGLNPIGASEVATRLFDTTKAKFHTAYEPGFRDWLKDVKGIHGASLWTAKKNRELRWEFGDAVDHALRNPSADAPPMVKKTASALSSIYGEFLKRARAAGVKGFENLPDNPTYAPRVFDWMRIAGLSEKYGSDRLEGFIAEAIAAGFRKAGTKIDGDIDALSKVMAKGYFKTIVARSNGWQPEVLHGMRLDDIDVVAKILDESGVPALEKANALQTLHRMLEAGKGEGGRVRYAHSRTILDEDFTARLRDKNGFEKEVSFRDLFMRTDAEQLFENYSRSMSGHIAMAEVVGVKSVEDHQRLMRHMGDLIEDTKARERYVEAMDTVYKLATGQPIINTSKYVAARRWGRALRDYNFMRVMNQVGFAQIPDSAALITPQYWKYTSKHFPELADFMKRAQDGTLDHRLAREMEELIATATDYHNNTLFSAFDDEPLSRMSRAEHALRVGGRVTQTISGLRHITEFQQRLGGMVAMNRIVANIAGRTKDMKESHLLDLGLTPEKIARIKAQIESNVEWDGKHKLMALETGKWTDEIALRDLAAAAHREARRMVQEEDIGDTFEWMHTPMGKIMLQFRRFPIVAYTKQLAHGLVHADAEVLAKTGYQVALGSAAYSAQMYLYSLTKSPEEAAAWRERYLSPQAIFLGGIFRAGMFSLMPQAGAAAWDFFIGDSSLKHARTTGLSNGLMGVPALDLVARTIEFGSDVAQSAIMSDKQFDQHDFASARKILPFQNAFVVKQMLDLMQRMLPEKDTDDDGIGVLSYDDEGSLSLGSE